LGAGVALVAAAGAGLWFAARTPEPPPVSIDRGPLPTSVLTVHVAGAVARPGLVVVPSGSRVADAVAGAGGALPDADLGALNLAAPLSDGQHLMVPSAAGRDGAAGAADDRVRINVASETDLQRLPGVGPVLAARIVEHRDRYGPFATVEDLLDVPGIGEGKLAALREAVLVP
jgi:competence protein ComEA